MSAAHAKRYVTAWRRRLARTTAAGQRGEVGEERSICASKESTPQGRRYNGEGGRRAARRYRTATYGGIGIRASEDNASCLRRGETALRVNEEQGR